MTHDRRPLEVARRDFNKAAGVGIAAGVSMSWMTFVQPPALAQTSFGSIVDIELNVNGEVRQLSVDPRISLLDALREHVGLTGTKKGCDHGQCGACTVIVDGRRMNSCLSLAVMLTGSEILTIEGLGSAEALHPMQAAFIERDGFQCGYCTPGQILSAVATLDEIAAGIPSSVTADVTVQSSASAEEIRERMSGNLCRCAAYPNIIAAITDVQEQR
ncbi:xanthine dehydrogenase YagT iron-sulfur-binding subunit [Rhizobium sp. NFR07]|uniref:2Fe-2S iron-sulfur cluster-binding protein n=1 Tax=Rhizobium sp. NFR07 TaxID=1566262 RepID=UPI0008EFA978|nr:2Fe-2S iron-sulfur cluster-binding protein [Rhizobium sp. NFR07]SFB56083.1 xanthine dehydrogenase YagT iron-sulfur-binding subunit [Rhizobium sp. NFR07]